MKTYGKEFWANVEEHSVENVLPFPMTLRGHTKTVTVTGRSYDALTDMEQYVGIVEHDADYAHLNTGETRVIRGLWKSLYDGELQPVNA